MNNNKDFADKWRAIAGQHAALADENELFVPFGGIPTTQRQVNLYYYFRFIDRVLQDRGSKDVLEIGCGRGTLALYLAAYRDYEPVLLDSADNAIAVARRSFERYGKPASFHVGNALATGLDGQSFDAVFSIGLAEHFSEADLHRLFAEQYRLLRPGGVMISLNIPKKRSVQALNTAMRTVKKWAGSYREPVGKDYFRNTLSPEAYRAAAQAAGFSDPAITHVCPFPIFTPVGRRTERMLARAYRAVLRVRALLQSYPYTTNRWLAQAHFLVAVKPHQAKRYE